MLQSIVNIVIAEILMLSAVWNDFTNDKSKSQLLEIKKSEQLNLSTICVHLKKKANILIINESKDFYVPLFMLRCESIMYSSTPMNFKED